MLSGRPPLLDHLIVLVVAAAVFYFFADIADIWGGGLFPNPLWLATASTTALAVVIPGRLRPSAVVGGALGCIAAGMLVFDDTLRGLATPCLGNMTETAIAVYLLPRVFTAELSLRRTRRSIAWIGTSILAAFVGGIVATLDTSSEVIGDRVESLLRWTLGDVVGLLLLPPLVIAFRSPWVLPKYNRWYLEAIGSAAILFAVLGATFATEAPFPYALVPIVMWFGIRFGPQLAMSAAMATALGATYLTSQGYGPFVQYGPDAVAQAQALNVAVALCALVASAHAVRAWNDQQQLRATLEAVPDVIVTLNDGGYAEGAWGPPDLREVVSDLVPTEPLDTDDPLSGAQAVIEPAPRLHHRSGRVIERRTTVVNEKVSLHLFRDVTAEQSVVDARLQLETRVDDARFQERQSLAQDLHDGPLQSTAAAHLLIEASLNTPTGSPELLEKAQVALDGAIVQLRESLTALADPADSGGALEPLAMFGSDVLQAVGIDLTTIDDTAGLTLNAGTRHALLLIGREAIMNAATHSNATRVTIHLTADDDHVNLEISDNGRGLQAQPLGDGRVHLGLVSMSERAERLGGSLDLASTRGGGTRIRARLPLDLS